MTLSTQVYRWVLANLMLGNNPAMEQHPIQEGVEILQLLHATETEISSGLILARKKTNIPINNNYH